MIADLIKRTLPRGFKDYIGTLVHPPAPYERDFTPEEIALYEAVEPFTMTSPESVVVLARTVEHLVRAGVPGTFVECGVWRGGSMLAVARVLARLGASDRRLVLFDTFEGMTPPTDRDRDIHGRTAAEILATQEKVMDKDSMWCYATEEDVRATLAHAGYPFERITLVRGRVEDTLPAQAPERIALLRLDTDWYESTRHELETCWDRLAPGGVLILDDYGLWEGQRQAADEFFRGRGLTPLIHRVDSKARLIVKEPDVAAAPRHAHQAAATTDSPTRTSRQ